MSKKEKNEPPRIKYKKPEAQRLVATKTHGLCADGSGDSGDCWFGGSAPGICDNGGGGGEP
jgi:hypothetical protein